MLKKIGVLKFKLDEKYGETYIRDIQLWRDKDNETDKDNAESLKGKFLCYIDINHFPLWILTKAVKSTCLTNSSTALSYFTAKLRRQSRGIVIELYQPAVSDYVILYRKNNQVECLQVELKMKKEIDDEIARLTSNNVNNTKDNNIDAILKQSQEKHLVHTRRIRQGIEISEKRLQFNETLSKLILGGLRLRGIPNTQSGFQKLYKMTFSAAEFTHRKELQQLTRTNSLDISFASLQSTVETLLELFTKS